jgi:hypothetical protein
VTGRKRVQTASGGCDLSELIQGPRTTSRSGRLGGRNLSGGVVRAVTGSGLPTVACARAFSIGVELSQETSEAQGLASVTPSVTYGSGTPTPHGWFLSDAVDKNWTKNGTGCRELVRGAGSRQKGFTWWPGDLLRRHR